MSGADVVALLSYFGVVGISALLLCFFSLIYLAVGVVICLGYAESASLFFKRKNEASIDLIGRRIGGSFAIFALTCLSLGYIALAANVIMANWPPSKMLPPWPLSESAIKERAGLTP